MKLINDTIGVNTKDLEIFLKLLSAYGEDIKNPYVVDASQSIIDHLFSGEDPLKSEFEAWSKGQIKFN
jgi:hypothetical protein